MFQQEANQEARFEIDIRNSGESEIFEAQCSDSSGIKRVLTL